MDNLYQRVWACLQVADPDEKVGLTGQAAEDWQAGRLDPSAQVPVAPIAAGRPARPRLVHPRDLPRRSLAHAAGRAALLHAVAHIEFNAINLAWDAVYRFRDLPRAYYDDWVRVAAEEAGHFVLLRERLRQLGRDYGDLPAHDGLWDMAARTAGDVLVRMALVPRVLEARGLDVTPGMIRGFRAAGDVESAQRLELILRDEETHVLAGSRWFRYCCARRGVEPESTYFALVEQYLNGEIRCPLHLEARRRAGFTPTELERLQAMCR